MLDTAIAFLKKDIQIFLSYRFNLIFKIGGIFAAVTFLFLIGNVIDKASLKFLDQYGGSYFAFLIIGIAFTDYTGISIDSYGNNIRDGQLTGTLEIILTSPTRLVPFLFSSALWGYLYTTFRLTLYFIAGIFLFGLEVGKANFAAALVIFCLTIVVAVSLGVIYAAAVLVFKQADSAKNAIGAVLFILSGLFFPPDVMPPWLAKIASYIPFTYSLKGLRLSILQGHSLDMLRTECIGLLLYAIILATISSFIFSLALKKAKAEGGLAQY